MSGINGQNASSAGSGKRVLTVAPMPPEKIAYALARYSRSPDSIRDSVEWVKTHDSSKFLESFYFQYGHASIADLGHVTICFEGISELAATEIEDEQLWDGQARSSRYQDFSQADVVIPPELTVDEAAIYEDAAENLLAAYGNVREQMAAYLEEQLPCPADMKPDAYKRNLAARAFDVARYLLPFGHSDRTWGRLPVSGRWRNRFGGSRLRSSRNCESWRVNWHRRVRILRIAGGRAKEQMRLWRRRWPGMQSRMSMQTGCGRT